MSLLINKLGVTIIRRYCTVMPCRISDEISGHHNSATDYICNLLQCRLGESAE